MGPGAFIYGHAPGSVGILLLEVSVVEALEAGAVAGFILAHFVNCVVDGVEVLLLCEGCDSLLVLACALLGEHSLLNVGLGVPYALAEELSELCCVLSLFPCVSLECLCDFMLALPVCLAAHREVHAYL